MSSISILKELVNWYESREEMPTNKLEEIYLASKKLIKDIEEENRRIADLLG
jgi:hypothetical protein